MITPELEARQGEPCAFPHCNGRLDVYDTLGSGHQDADPIKDSHSATRHARFPLARPSYEAENDGEWGPRPVLDMRDVSKEDGNWHLYLGLEEETVTAEQARALAGWLLLEADNVDRLNADQPERRHEMLGLPKIGLRKRS
ncbi:hypothetical protein [Rathayibacter sp. Leaf248]|uniref:hypothetical protein n=1 Tax=Rathayibacter sp. Leaf248 TaxID=2876555 RepID=UPI001E2CDE5E|nr:hypothetical protein [Rathayibacter sp. Leaf248]